MPKGKKLFAKTVNEKENVKTIEVSQNVSQNVTDITKQSEPSVPLSQLNDLLDNMLKERLKNFETKQEPKAEIYPKVKDVNYDDIPELRDFVPKNRVYVLLTDTNPINHGIRTRHKKESPLQYLNPETKEVHPLRFSRSQVSFFSDKQTGDVSVEYVLFKNKFLYVTENDVSLQKFLRIHPDNQINGGVKYKEYNPSEDAEKELELEDELFNAQKIAREISILKLDAIARLICSDYNESWSNEELRRAVYIQLKKNPKYFLKLANDYSIEVKGVAKTAYDRGIISYKNDTFYNDDEAFLAVGKNDDRWDAISKYLLEEKEGRVFYEYLKNSI